MLLADANNAKIFSCAHSFTVCERLFCYYRWLRVSPCLHLRLLPPDCVADTQIEVS